MAILFSIYNFWSAVFILPQSVVTQVDKKCRDFIWGAAEDKRKNYLVVWDKVCTPKKNVRLNIKGCCNWNTATVGKLLWQLYRKKKYFTGEMGQSYLHEGQRKHMGTYFNMRL